MTQPIQEGVIAAAKRLADYADTMAETRLWIEREARNLEARWSKTAEDRNAQSN